MAKGQTVAIWIILVVVLAAAAGVIVIAVQNNKREQQLGPVESAATLYNQNNAPKPALGRPSMRVANSQRQPGRPKPGRSDVAQVNRVPARDRYDVAMVNAQNQLSNRLPPSSFNSSTYNTNVSMTSFAPLPGPSHIMSTTPSNYVPRSGGGALFIPSKSPQADMPAQQLNVSHNFPSTVNKLQDMSSPISIGGEKGAAGTTLSNFVGSSYFQDPATMTPNTFADGLGLDAYLPDVSNATPDGLDPQTGLPVFSTASLKRSNDLSSYGVNGFLRPVLDDTQGYKHNVGKRKCPERYNDCDLDRRRNQFNAARINSGNDDIVLFNANEFMYTK
jgi:hypothetical protein